MKKQKVLSLIFLGIFILFLICFFTTSTLVQKGVIANIEFSSAVQAVLASITFLPLILSLFFLGQHLKSKSGIWQNVYKILNFVSIALFCYLLVFVIFSFFS